MLKKPAVAAGFFMPGINIGRRCRPCGSWLASDGGLSDNIDVECAGLIAGKPAPTGSDVNSGSVLGIPAGEYRWQIRQAANFGIR
ncbi:hypothetical protein EJA70_06130 [Pseudomonas sp. PB103]|nr:hypothetical protein EJA70_06130 [Pseudomonas sp. PB103]